MRGRSKKVMLSTSSGLKRTTEPTLPCSLNISEMFLWYRKVAIDGSLIALFCEGTVHR